MKNLKCLLTILAGLAFLGIGAQNQVLNVEDSNFSWTGKAAFNAYALTGSLKAEKGEINIVDDYIQALSIIINMKSLDHENSDLKNHLRSADFFEVNTFERATFKLLKPAKLENGKALIVGTMTIKDRSQIETIAVMFKNGILSFNHVMDRTVYDIKYNSPSFFKKMKENAIADNFELKGTLLFR